MIPADPVTSGSMSWKRSLLLMTGYRTSECAKRRSIIYAERRPALYWKNTHFNKQSVWRDVYNCLFVVSRYSIWISNYMYWAPLWHCKINCVQNSARGGWCYCEHTTEEVCSISSWRPIENCCQWIWVKMEFPTVCWWNWWMPHTSAGSPFKSYGLLQQKWLVLHYSSGCGGPQVHIPRCLLWLAWVRSWLKGIHHCMQKRVMERFFRERHVYWMECMYSGPSIIWTPLVTVDSSGVRIIELFG